MGALLSCITTLSPSSSNQKLTARTVEGEVPTKLPEPATSTSAKIKEGDPREVTDNDGLSYWNVNIPRDRWTVTCPEFLQGLDQGKKRRHEEMLSIPANKFQATSWQEVKKLIDNDQIDQFVREPRNHRQYLAFAYYMKHTYGSLENYMATRRLGWTDLTPKGAPFTHPDDVRVIYNDWPYGIDKRIVHLCVWTKFELPIDKHTKRLKPEVKQLIVNYFEKTFLRKIPADNARWFMNWPDLKSIHELEHFQVMLFDPDIELVREITKNDIPRCLII